jgi:hypothetical protein
MYLESKDGVTWISDVGDYNDPLSLVDAVIDEGVDSNVVMCVTVGYQEDTERMLYKLGFIVVNQGDKDQHSRQREKDSEYVKLWAGSADIFSKENWKKMQDERIKLYFEIEGYEFLKMDKGDLRFSPEVADAQEYPFFKVPVSVDGVHRLKELHKKSFGFIIPSINPFNGYKIWDIYDLENFLGKLKDYKNA